MGVLDSSYIKTIGVKSPGHKKIFFILSDTLLDMHQTGGGELNLFPPCLKELPWARQVSSPHHQIGFGFVAKVKKSTNTEAAMLSGAAASHFSQISWTLMDIRRTHS